MAGNASRRACARPVKLALLHNPHSGFNRRHPARVLDAAAKCGIRAWSISSREEMYAALREIADAGTTLLIVNGGDGTVDGAAGWIRRQKLTPEPKLCLLAGGTTNMIARDVGMPGQPHRALEKLVAAVRSGTRLREVLRAPFAVHGTAQGATPLGFFLGGGALPDLLRTVQHGLHARGFIGRGGEVLALLQTALRLIRGNVQRDPVLAPTRLVRTSIQASNTSEESDVILYFVTSLDRLVLGIDSAQPAPSLRLLALNFPYKNLLSSLARLVGGKPIEHLGPNFLFQQGARLKLQFPGEIVLDGEAVALPPGTRGVELELAAPLTFCRI